jgi:hypothetical protein
MAHADRMANAVVGHLLFPYDTLRSHFEASTIRLTNRGACVSPEPSGRRFHSPGRGGKFKPMKLVAGLALIILLTITGPIQAADIPSQPLTRFECDTAGLVWNENSNVCGVGSEEAKVSSSVESSSQPLTRAACDQVGMTWDEKGNVCGSSEGSGLAAEAASQTVAAEAPSQPLTRAACDISGMRPQTSAAWRQCLVLEPRCKPLW